jgi:hypothetical protein
LFLPRRTVEPLTARLPPEFTRHSARGSVEDALTLGIAEMCRADRLPVDLTPLPRCGTSATDLRRSAISADADEQLPLWICEVRFEKGKRAGGLHVRHRPLGLETLREQSRGIAVNPAMSPGTADAITDRIGRPASPPDSGLHRRFPVLRSSVGTVLSAPITVAAPARRVVCSMPVPSAA